MTDADLHSQLRLEVGRFRTQERHRVFDPVLSVGAPAGDRVSVTLPTRVLEYVDRQVRVELISALLERTEASSLPAWLCRPGSPTPDADDRAWAVSSQVAFGAAGLTLSGFFVVTRDGWADVHTGESRIWRRLRC